MIRLKLQESIQVKKLSKLVKDQGTVNDPEKVIFNFSNHELTTFEKSLLSKGLKFAVPIKRIEYAEYLENFELLGISIKVVKTTVPAKNEILSSIKNIGLESFRSFNNDKTTSNLSDGERDAIKSLSMNKNIIIQKSDKGNSVVVVNKNDYINRVKGLLSDESKFKPVKVKSGAELRLVLNEEDRVTKIVKTLTDRNVFTHEQYKRFTPTGTHAGILYDLPKVHKPLVNKFPRYRPIVSNIGTPTYELASFLVPMIATITEDEYSVKDSFSFAKEICNQDTSLHMASMDIESLFTNIPLEETIEICTKNLYSENTIIKGITEDDFRNLLRLAVKDNLIMFNGEYYIQCDGVAMGSPLGPTLANAFLCHYEDKWIQQCPAEYRPLYYRRYVDDIFVLFSMPEHEGKFKDYMNTCHPSILFTCEGEKEGILSFLDVEISRENDSFVTSVYRKPSFSGVYMHFDSFQPINYKYGLLFTLLFRCFTLCSDYKKFHEEVIKIKEIFRKNGYPRSFIETCVTSFFKRLHMVKPTIQVDNKKEVLISLPYLGKHSLKVKKRLITTFTQLLPTCKLKVCFKTSNCLQKIFSFKDKISNELKSGLIYKYTCRNCNISYYGKTTRHSNRRFCEHLSISPFTGKKVKQLPCQVTAVGKHLIDSKHDASLDDFSFVSVSCPNDFKLKIRESLLIRRDNPLLCKQKASFPLVVFK